jgi:hypothetical protein
MIAHLGNFEIRTISLENQHDDYHTSLDSDSPINISKTIH